MPKMPTLTAAQGPTGQRIGAFATQRPSRSQVSARGEFANRVDQQPDRRIGDLLGQHVRRVGHHDAARAGMAGIDPIVADAETGNDLELRQRIDEGRV